LSVKNHLSHCRSREEIGIHHHSRVPASRVRVSVRDRYIETGIHHHIPRLASREDKEESRPPMRVSRLSSRFKGLGFGVLPMVMSAYLL